MALEYSTRETADGVHRHIYEIVDGAIIRSHYACGDIVDSTTHRETPHGVLKEPLLPGSHQAWTIVRFNAVWGLIKKVP